MLKPVDLKTDIRVVRGEGTLGQIGVLAKELGFSRTLLVADPGLAKAGHLAHAHAFLDAWSAVVVLDPKAHENPGRLFGESPSSSPV